MRETIFIQQNRDKWGEFEDLLDDPRPDADKLSDLFIQVTDDLSYARTFYPRRSVRVYLNGLAQKVFFLIYQSRKPVWKKLSRFWTHQLPSLTWDSRKSLQLSFLIFTTATFIGLLSAHADPDFSESILGSSYVSMTEENIAKGDPMAVYKQHGEFNMFLGITLNNITVALYTFALGLVFAIGTIGILIRNGVMFGAFIHLFVKADLLKESLLTVMMHGTLELSSIVIAGAAGMTMGSGLVFPGSYSRMKSFQLSARRGINLLLGTLPLFVIAGFVESYFTRHTDAPDLLRAFFILACLAFVVFYFWWYPRYLARNGLLEKTEGTPAPESDKVIELDKIKSTGDIYYETFVIIRGLFGKVFWVCLAGTLFFCSGVFLTASYPPTELFYFPDGLFGTLSAVPSFFKNPNHPFIYAFWILSIGGILTYLSRQWFKETSQPKKLSHLVLSSILLAGALGGFTLIESTALQLLMLLFLSPFVFITCYAMSLWGLNLAHSLGLASQFLRNSYAGITMLAFTLLLSGFLFFLLLDSGVTGFLVDTLSMNLNLEEETGIQLITIAYTGLSFLFLTLIISIWYFAFVLQFYSCLEINSAVGLMKKLENLATSHRIRGLERE
ncbi:MAG: hypothetical protein Kow0027_26140 [Saprospiraceae bacterium]